MCIDHEIKSSLKKIIKLDSYVVFSKNKVDYMYKSMELYINEEFRMDTFMAMRSDSITVKKLDASNITTANPDYKSTRMF